MKIRCSRLSFSLLVFAALILSGCGVKPSSLETSNPSDFPGRYPDVSTDPLPTGPPPLP